MQEFIPLFQRIAAGEYGESVSGCPDRFLILADVENTRGHKISLGRAMSRAGVTRVDRGDYSVTREQAAQWLKMTDGALWYTKWEDTGALEWLGATLERRRPFVILGWEGEEVLGSVDTMGRFLSAANKYDQRMKGKLCTLRILGLRAWLVR